MTAVIIGGIENQTENFTYTMEELQALAEADNLEVVASIHQKLERPVAATYFGAGKVTEIFQAGQVHAADALIVNDELSPTQIRNLEQDTGLTVIDRTALILDIFASRARTREAKLQVEIAKLQYQLPRLRTSAAEKLDQQTAGNAGGGFTNRGAGETKLELNRRVIEKQISQLRKKLKDVQKDQVTQSKQRRASGLPQVALVGYTNAGKSTTMNGLLQLTGQEEDKQVFVKNMLFATLDTSVRKVHFADNKEFLLSDTVGFVSKLPHTLVAAFESTLAEARNADLLVQVVDASDPHAREMIATTEETLASIGIDDIPMIYAYNKADLANTRYPLVTGDTITYSARDSQSLQVLADVIRQKIFTGYQTLTFLIPFAEGQLVQQLNEEAQIIKTDYLATGTQITAEVSPQLAAQLQDYVQ